MFTGIVTALGTVTAIDPIARGRDMRLTIATPAEFLDDPPVALGASIACSGCCLTAIEFGADWFAVDASAETLAHTKLGTWTQGSRVNLERSLRMGDELGGHLVSGHVDAVGTVVSTTPENASHRWVFRVPKDLARFIAVKGSIAVDGVSLTVNEVGDDTFGVNIIPHTTAVTTFGTTKPGDKVNIEIDMLARYVARLRETA
ncbi:MAG TPA: riboflavin synthase [Rhodopila sp.]|uniref:riboflavin synthase n=1 Tax=Rhodopila sp. TaxID=2480087 RepID=UPI002C0A9052|nr:riboflavin synthase [Rhodopila sp.]HVY16926.1 riboflavin synthase [Rhodopila sp.]